MEQQTDISLLLGQINRPAFCVSGEVITCVNHSAQGRMISPGMNVLPLLTTGQSEYENFSCGYLCLALEISGVCYDASVSRLSDYNLFVLDPPQSESELNVLALASREIREPLSRIMAITDRFFANLDPDDSNLQNQISRINRCLYQLLRITNNMSDAVSYQVSRPHLELLDLSAVLTEIFDHAKVLCEAAGITLEFVPYPQPIYTLVDYERLERAVYNLISNSLKFSSNGSSIRAKLTQRGFTAFLTIHDSGSGIDFSSCGSLFTRYLREPSIEDPRHGIGLGLSLVRSVAALHKGTVLMEPCDSGARITMSIAIRQESILSSPSVPPSLGYDPGLVELSDSLPSECYHPDKI